MPARVIVAAVALVSVLNSAARTSSIGNPASDANVERHHYSINARVRPLLFWIDCRDVGDAIVTVRRHGDGTGYSLLIGSDPQRTPQRINRWGYLDEDTHGTSATVIGLMTESDERSLAQAKANVETSAATQMFKLIRSSVTSDEARSLITAMAVPSDYSFRQVRTVLDLARRESPEGKVRTIRVPPGTRPGFLAALSDAMRSSAGPIAYVYHGRIYELRQTEARPIPDLRIGRASYGRAIAADFTITSADDGEHTRFSMTYGTEGRFAQVPLTVLYRPRWWMEVNLTLDDEMDAAALGGDVDR